MAVVIPPGLSELFSFSLYGGGVELFGHNHHYVAGGSPEERQFAANENAEGDVDVMTKFVDMSLQQLRVQFITGDGAYSIPSTYLNFYSFKEYLDNYEGTYEVGVNISNDTEVGIAAGMCLDPCAPFGRITTPESLSMTDEMMETMGNTFVKLLGKALFLGTLFSLKLVEENHEPYEGY